MTWLSYRPYQFLQTLYWDGFRGRFGNYRGKLFNTGRRPVSLGSFEEAVHSLTAAVHLLTARAASGTASGTHTVGTPRISHGKAA